MGECLLGLADLGCTVKSLRPISGGATGPAFRAVDPVGIAWDVWFESGGAWSYQPYGQAQPYKRAALGASGGYQPLGADIMILAPGRRALVVECKYGNAEYVCRQGYLQTVTYAVEAKELAPDVTGLVIGPDGSVACGVTETSVGRIAIATPSYLPKALGEVIGQAG
jgi:hypothetical protein